jgi:hypothetical protein
MHACNGTFYILISPGRYALATTFIRAIVREVRLGLMIGSRAYRSRFLAAYLTRWLVWLPISVLSSCAKFWCRNVPQKPSQEILLIPYLANR